MKDLIEGIKSLIDLEIKHIQMGFVDKEFAANAIEGFIVSITPEGEANVETQNLLNKLSLWAKLYIKNLNI